MSRPLPQKMSLLQNVKAVPSTPIRLNVQVRRFCQAVDKTVGQMLEDPQIEEAARVGQRFKSEAILGNGSICSGRKKFYKIEHHCKIISFL